MNSGVGIDNHSSLLKVLFKHGVSHVQPRNILKNYLSTSKESLVINDGKNKIIYKDFKSVYASLCWESFS